jgi:hypothetical protein
MGKRGKNREEDKRGRERSKEFNIICANTENIRVFPEQSTVTKLRYSVD